MPLLSGFFGGPQLIRGFAPNGFGPRDIDLWGHPVDKLRYGVTSWQRVTLLERTHVRR